MSSRSFRLETRSRARDEIKRIMQTVEKVRKWEKKWIDLGLSNSLKVYKWVPVRDENKDDDSDEENKENEPVELTETNLEQNNNGEGDLPDIKLNNTVPQPMGVDSSSLMASQAPPDMLLGSEEGEKTQSSSEVAAGSIDDTPGTAAQDTKQTGKDGQVDDGTKGVALEEEQPVVAPAECADEAKPNSTEHDTSGEAMETATMVTETTETAITETETMETETSGSNDGGNENIDGSLSVQQSSAPETSTAETSDSSSVVTSQANETVEQISNEPAKSSENQSAEGDGKAAGEPSESMTAVEEVIPEESNTEASKEGGVSEKEERGASEETGDQQQVHIEDTEQRGEKRGCGEALEGNSSPPSPKRPRSHSPQTL